MSDTSVFLWINGLAGHVRVIDEFFKDVSNDYFALITACLILVWMWFGTRDGVQRERNQKTVFFAMISIGIVSAFMGIINHYYFRVRPFDMLPAGSVHLLYYKPVDSSFPSNIAAVLFAIVTPVFIRNRKYGYWLLALAVLVSFGRVYIGVHYPLDVLGGAALGILNGILCMGIGWGFGWLMNLLLKLFRFFYIA
jgi:undecaprenyl-diphosphatase